MRSKTEEVNFIKIEDFVSKPLFNEKIVTSKDPSYPKITVITPSYNQGIFLERTILSVLNQNYPNLEYIIIDGGSTDESVNIIKKYEKYLTFWVSEKDNGQSDAINKGMKIATGEYVGWLNSDDELNIGALHFMAEEIKKLKKYSSHNLPVAFFGIVQLIDEEENHIKFHPFSEKISLKSTLYQKTPITQPGSFYSLEALKKVGFLDTSLIYCMDLDLWLKLLRIGEFYFLPYIMARFRIHSGSKSCNKPLKYVEESINVYKKYGGSLFSRSFLKRVIRYMLSKILGKKYIKPIKTENFWKSYSNREKQ